MPPRLLDHRSTLTWASSTRSHKYPTFWSFDSGPGGNGLESVRGDAERAHRVGDVVRARDGAAPEDTGAQDPRGGYPFVTLVVIVITANHYVLDAVGGLVILAIGWVLGEQVHACVAERPRPDELGSCGVRT